MVRCVATSPIECFKRQFPDGHRDINPFSITPAGKRELRQLDIGFSFRLGTMPLDIALIGAQQCFANTMSRRVPDGFCRLWSPDELVITLPGGWGLLGQSFLSLYTTLRGMPQLLICLLYTSDAADE